MTGLATTALRVGIAVHAGAASPSKAVEVLRPQTNRVVAERQMVSACSQEIKGIGL